MKIKVISRTTICFLFLSIVFPGLFSAQRFKAGIAGSFNYVRMNGFPEDSGVSRESKTTFSYGLFGSYFLKPGFQLNLDVLYAEMGDKFKEDDTTMDFKHHYLHLPLTLRYYFNNDFNGFFIEGGPQLNFLIDQTLDISSNQQSASIATDEFFRQADIDAKLNSTEVAALAGIGLRESMITLGVKYMYGLTPVFSGEELKDVRNSALMLYLSLKF